MQKDNGYRIATVTRQEAGPSILLSLLAHLANDLAETVDQFKTFSCYLIVPPMRGLTVAGNIFGF